jgi:hypothetical protein
VDLLEEVLESINQELPDDIKDSSEPISQLDNHFCNSEESLEEPILSTSPGTKES